MIFSFDASAIFEAKDLQEACRKLSEQFARMGEQDWKGKDPTTDGVFKRGHVSLNASLFLKNKKRKARPV